jgi:hypothetical protein
VRVCESTTLVIQGRAHSASKTRVNALVGANPESRCKHRDHFWIPGPAP